MKLTREQLDNLKVIAEKAAIEAGNIISLYKDKNVKVKNKESGTSIASQVLTEVDLLSQKIILNALDRSIHEYDLGLLAEEIPDNKSRFIKDYFWCIDPLDGTLSFIEKNYGFTVSIALVTKEGEPIIGVVFDPVTNSLYSAQKGFGVYKNGININYKKDYNIPIRGIVDKETKLNNFKLSSYGGAVSNVIQILENNTDCYFKPPKKEVGGGSIWDFAATKLLLTEAGGFVSNFSGEKLSLNSKEGTFMNFCGVIFSRSRGIQEKIIENYYSINQSQI